MVRKHSYFYDPVYSKLSLVKEIVWYRTGDKPLFQPTLTHLTDAYMRHQASMCKHAPSMVAHVVMIIKRLLDDL